MARKKVSETVTENIFRDFYGANTFIEKSAIPSGYGFTSKKGTSYSGYPDFFCDSGDYCIVVEAKATDHAAAQDEVQYYMINNKIHKDIIGISVSGQSRENILVTYYLKLMGMTDIKSFPQENTLLSIPAIKKQYVKTKYGESVTTEALITVLKDLNKRFNENNKVRDTDRSLFFSGLMIALKNNNFIDKNGTWPDIEDTIFDAISNSKEIPGVCQKKKIYKNGVLNCAGVQTRRNSNYEMVKVSTLFHVTKGTLASESNIDGDYPFVTASEEWKTHTEYALDTEAIVYAVSAAGSLGRSHYVNGKFIASNLCLVLTSKRDPKYPIDLEFYNCYFASIKKQIVSDLADGTSKLTISPDMFKDYYIDYIPYEEQQAFVKTKLKDFLKLQEKYRQAQEKLSQDIANLSD